MIRCLFCHAPRRQPCDPSQHPEGFPDPQPIDPTPSPREWMREHGATPVSERVKQLTVVVEGRS